VAPPAADGSAGADTITPLLNQALALFGSYEVTITPAATRTDGKLNSQIIEWQKAAGRDLLAMTPQLQAKAEASMGEALKALFEEGLELARAIPMLGEGVLEHIVERLELSGASGPPDVKWTENAPSWVKRKKHANVLHGLTGKLAEGLADARVETRKVG
jgi:hypothetical protein